MRWHVLLTVAISLATRIAAAQTPDTGQSAAAAPSANDGRLSATRTAGFLAGWQDRTGEEGFRDVGAPAPFGGWFSIGSPTVQAEIEVSRANAREAVSRGTDRSGVPVVWLHREQDTAVDLTVVRLFRTQRGPQLHVLGGVGVLIENNFDDLLVPLPPNSSFFETFRPGHNIKHRWTVVGGVGFDVAIVNKWLARIEYRLDFSEGAGTQQFLAGIGAVF